MLFEPVGQKLIIVHESSSISAFTSMTNGAGKRDRAASGHVSPPPYVTELFSSLVDGVVAVAVWCGVSGDR
ncbi:hypothetical protein ACWDNI_36950 [Nocardia niigatensis]